MKIPTDLSKEKFLAFFPFYYFFCSCSGAREPLPNPRVVGSPDLQSQEATCPSVQFPVLTPSPFTCNPSPQLPVWPTATTECFWTFLNFTKWAYFKILSQIAFFLLSQILLSNNSSSLWRKLCSSSIWKINLGHFNTWETAENSRLC